MPKLLKPAVAPIADSHFRSGDQAEYLTQYLLSNFGASILIPRQEDHGFDFFCTLNSAPPGALPEFHDSFYLQVKVGKPAEVALGGRTTGKVWRKGRLHWFLNLDIPLLLGFMDLAQKEIVIYQTSARWLLYYRTIHGPQPFEVMLCPTQSVSEPKDRKANKIKPNGEHDGKRWRVSLGPPLVAIKLADLTNSSALRGIKELIGNYIALERLNCAHRILRTQWGQWVSRMRPRRKSFDPAWVVEERRFPRSDDVFFHECGLVLASLIFRLQSARNRRARRQASDLFRQLDNRWKLSAASRALIEKALAPNR